MCVKVLVSSVVRCSTAIRASAPAGLTEGLGDGRRAVRRDELRRRALEGPFGVMKGPAHCTAAGHHVRLALAFRARQGE